MKRFLFIFVVIAFGIALVVCPSHATIMGSLMGGSGSGTDANAIHDNVAGEITALTNKASPHANDAIVAEDSEDGNKKKKILIGNLAGSGDMTKAVYDTEPDNRVDKAESVDDGTYSASAEDIEDAVDKKHAKDNDDYLDYGGTYEVSAQNAKDAVDKKHEQNKDQYLDQNGANECAAIDVADAVTKKHTQNSDTGTNSNTFQLGTSGIYFKNNSGVIEFWNSTLTEKILVKASGFAADQSATTAGGWDGYEKSGNGTDYYRHEVPDAIPSPLIFKYIADLPVDHYWRAWGTPSGGISTQEWMHIDTAYMDYNAGAISPKAASTSQSGRVQIATSNETSTGTENTKAVSPEAFRGSNYGKETIILKVIADDTALTTGDGKSHITIPSKIHGWELIEVDAHVYTKSSSGLVTVQIYNLTDTQDILSTLLTIDVDEYDSYTATTPPVINTAYDDVNEAEVFRIDVDGAGTGTKGLELRFTFAKPGA